MGNSPLLFLCLFFDIVFGTYFVLELEIGVVLEHSNGLAAVDPNAEEGVVAIVLVHPKGLVGVDLGGGNEGAKNGMAGGGRLGRVA